MYCFLGIGTRHNRQVDGPSQIDQISVRLIFDFHCPCLLLFLFFFLGAFVCILIVVLVVTSFAQNLCLELLVRFFVILPLCVKLEYVQAVLNVDFTVQFNPMGDLVFLFHQVKFFLDCRIVLEFVFAHLKQNLDHVLRSLVNVGLMQDVSELIEYGD